MRFLSPQAANIAIRYGLILAGKHVRLRLLKPEPVRCLNCNQYNVGHIAINCPNKVACGNCAGEHHTTTCPHKNNEHLRCSNCEQTGHAAWSRDCPEFIRWKNQIQALQGSGGYKYVVTEEEWTWERVGDPQCNYTSARYDSNNNQTHAIPPPNSSHTRAWDKRINTNGHKNTQAGLGPTTIANKMKRLAD